MRRYAIVGWFGLLSLCWGQTEPGRFPLATETIETVEPPLADGIVQAQATAAAPAGKASTPPAVPTRNEPPPPVVTLSLRVPAALGIGQEAEYRLLLENKATVPAHHTVVSFPLPAGTQFVKANPPADPPKPGASGPPTYLWSLNSFAPNARKEIIVVLKPDPAANEIRAVAHVRYEHGQSVLTQLSKPRLQIKKKGPREAVLNEAIPFTIEIVNPAQVDVANVVIVDSLPAGFEFEPNAGNMPPPNTAAPATGGAQRAWNVGTLKPGQRRLIEYKVFARKAGTLLNDVVATANAGVREQTSWSVRVTEPRLSLEHVGPKLRHVGQLAEYRVVVRNTGTATLNNVVVTDVLPARATLERATSGGQKYGEKMQWIFPTLAPGGAETITVQLRVSEGGPKVNRVTVSADRGATQEQAVGTDFLAAAALQLDAQQAANPVEVNGENSYTITVRNTGTATATNVQVQAIWPAQLLALRQVPAGAKPNGAELLFEPFTLAPGQSKAVTLEMQARQAGDVRLVARLRADQLSSPVEEEVQTTVFNDAPPTLPPAKP
jgi:uncharacterized repeat protein (TIGR01451 family)